MSCPVACSLYVRRIALVVNVCILFALLWNGSIISRFIDVSLHCLYLVLVLNPVPHFICAFATSNCYIDRACETHMVVCVLCN